ncbi:hypothetical protein Raf01_24190 [Rugosimonospora africana]|uniref:CBM2 domain-containing protein n=2 Tax=Rugosimonospora africana TaxID=556532 RepID=A0A8J3VPS1_9ACTN|nr:hypothetical protein Raf01_24190 [Rugosimonospora africana]
MFKSPLYWATLAGVTAAGLAIVAMPDAQAAPANQVTSLAGTVATGSSSTDTQPPTTPTNLAASFRCDSTQGVLLTLSWTASTDNVGVTGYDVYFARGASSGPFAFVATTATTSYTQPVTAGSYEVRARDAAGNTSDFTAPLLVLPPPSPCPTNPTSPPPADIQAPTTPTNLTASFRCDSTQGVLVTLNWTASTDNVGVTGYDVYATQGVSSSSFGFVATTATTSYTQPVTLGYFEVRARDAAGNTSDFTAPRLVAPPPSPCPTHPADHGTCTAAYRLGSSWPGGFQGQVTVKNTGTDAAKSWTVTLAFANGQTVTQVWGASLTSTANPYTFGSLAYNATLSPGASTTFGFLGSWNGTNTAPVATCTRT